MIIEYDTALQTDGFDDIINGSLSDRYEEIVSALERCGAVQEADNLRETKKLFDCGPEGMTRRMTNSIMVAFGSLRGFILTEIWTGVYLTKSKI